MSFPVATAFLKALGWALVNSLWQFAICWLGYYLITLAFPRLAAAIKHRIALLILCAGSLLFLSEMVTACIGKPVSSFPTHFSLRGYAHPADALQTFTHRADLLLPYASIVYLFCIVWLFVKFCFFVQHASQLRRQGVSKISASWRIYIADTAALLGIKRNVQTFLSANIDTPQVIGILKPVILIPAACIANLTTDQLEAVLLHELVHIRRNDYLTNVFIAGIEILFFFNPFVKQLTAQIRKEREYSCDDMVIQFRYHPENYASALLTLEKNRLIPVTYGIAASGKGEKQLLTRIERIVGLKTKKNGSWQAVMTLLLLLMLASFAGMHSSISGNDALDTSALVFDYNSMTGAPYAHVDSGYNGDEKSPASIRKSVETIQLITIKAVNTTASKNALQSVTVKKINKNTAQSNTQSADDLYAAVAPAVEEENADNAISAAQTETRDFSLLSDEPVTNTYTPSAPQVEPYVPSNSFSFHITQDTALPKVKGLTYQERKANEAMLNTQKALAAINWQKIEKQLNVKGIELTKLKQAINAQLQQLNWQNVHLQVQEDINQQNLRKLHDAITQEQLLKQYQQSEGYLEALQRQLSEQSEMIRLSDEQVKKAGKAAVDQQKKLQLEMKKRKIIYI